MAPREAWGYRRGMAKNTNRLLKRAKAVRRKIDAFEAKVPADQRSSDAVELLEFMRTHLDVLERDAQEDSDA